ncbi:hypothetical protein GCM10023116_11990 [Kistimonas scapharcae]|uniref:DUF4892 domain-containing protein n=1 Tax=Kistimonas scapharcae TaxID=1036133 RepID=A0ABP8V0Q7_9GAMM
MQRILFSLCLLSLWGSAYSSSIPGSTDLPGIDRYPNADIVRYGEGEKVNYPLVASTIKKVNGVVRADEERRLDGAWRRVIYQMPDGHGSDAGFRYFSDRLDKLGVKTLYQCDGRHCGPSNLWANKVFEEANLYGLDKDQFYLLGARTVENQTEYYVLYTVRRGNKRVYAMVDQLVVEGALPTVPGSENGLKASGMAQYWDAVVQPGAGTIVQQDFDKILAQIQNDSTTQVVLAGSVPFVPELKPDQQIERSRQYAQALKERLIEENVAESRLSVIGTGPLLQEKVDDAMPFVRIMVIESH